jgi:predicted RNase H-like HicB family nuclease
MLEELVFRAEFFQEDDLYVGLCHELNVSSFGEDIEDAKCSLLEAVYAFIEACEEMGTLEEVLEEAGFFKENGVWFSREPIAEERLAISR